MTTKVVVEDRGNLSRVAASWAPQGTRLVLAREAVFVVVAQPAPAEREREGEVGGQGLS